MNNTHTIIVGFALALAPLASLHAAEQLRPANKPTADSKTAGEAGALRVRVGGKSYVSLGGEVGKAADDSINRFRSAPYDSLAWIRADLTGEKVSEFDDKKGHIKYRPYKN